MNVFFVTEQIFTAFFAIELAMRLGAEGLLYLKSIAHAADAFIVVVCSLDSWVFTPMGVEGMKSLVLLRFLRLLRLAKVFRVVRVMRVFTSLRVLVGAIITSVGALLWSMTLLFVIELSTGLLISRLLFPVIQDPDTNPSLREFLWTKFGTCVRAFLTMFEVTMAPGAFMAYRFLFDELGPMIIIFFMVYVIFVTFAVIRVITAMFLKSTLSAHSSDEKSQAHQRQKEAFTELLQCMQNPDPSNEDGDLFCKDDLTEMLQLPRLAEWLEEIEVSTKEAIWLYDVLDFGNGVHFKNYVNVLLRMKGNARAADAVLQLYEFQQISIRVNTLERYFDKSLPRVSAREQKTQKVGEPSIEAEVVAAL
jgi:hypothetical protein